MSTNLEMDGPPPGWRRTPPLRVGGTQKTLAENGGPIVTTLTGGEFGDYCEGNKALQGVTYQAFGMSGDNSSYKDKEIGGYIILLGLP